MSALVVDDPTRIGDGDVVHGDPDGLIQVVVCDDPDAVRAVHDAADRYRCIRWTVREGPATFINGVRWRPGPGHVLYGDLCRLAEVTRPLWGFR
jgi:hypothetical protein